MRDKKTSIKSFNSIKPCSILESNLSESTGHSSWLSQQLLAYYKHKSTKLEREYNELLEIVENVKSTCDLSNEFRSQLNLRNGEVSKLQQLVGDLQIQLFKEREDNLKLISENDKLKIQDYQNKKKINLLLMVNGTTEKKFYHFMTTNISGKFVSSELLPKLQSLKEQKHKQVTKYLNSGGSGNTSDDQDLQALMLNNQVLESQLEHHVKISKEQIEVLMKERELQVEERKIETQRLQNNIDLINSKLKESQNLLCETTERLIKSKNGFEKDRTAWMEEKDKYLKAIEIMKIRLGEDALDICDSGFVENNNYRIRLCTENDVMRAKILEKERLAASYQKQVLVLQEEIMNLKERAETCKRIFKEKTERMTSQVAYLKNKYEDLDRRRHLEAEGFRTDIRMLRERLKELEKKIEKASGRQQTSEQQQLLVSARNTLNRAKQLEKELAYVNSKIHALESNTEAYGS